MPSSKLMLHLGLFVLLSGAHAEAQTVVPKDPGIVSRHGEWTLLCKPPPRGGTRQLCAVTQTVVAADHDNDDCVTIKNAAAPDVRELAD